MAQLERSDKARIETEARMIDLKTENTKITEKYNKSSSSIRSLNSELKEYKEKLKTSEESLIRMSVCILLKVVLYGNNHKNVYLIGML